MKTQEDFGKRKKDKTHRRGVLGEVFQDLKLYISTLSSRSTESSGTSDNESVRSFVIFHRRNEIVEVWADTGVLVGRNYKRVALTVENSLCHLLSRVDERNYLETRTQFVLESERVIPGSFVTSKVDVSGSNEDKVELRTVRANEQHCQHPCSDRKFAIAKVSIAYPGAAGLLMVIGPSLD